MNKHYYYELMLKELEKQDGNNKKRLLLHVCCAVCSSWVILYLSQYFDVTLFFNNSNIYPRREFEKRLSELERYIQESGQEVEVVVAEYNSGYQKDFFDYKDLKEGQQRCELCIARRMEEAYLYAQQQNFAYFTTVMSVSRNKDAIMINEIGAELQKKYTPKYLYGDFKKNEGIVKTNAVVSEYAIYRQNYCGCVYSLRRPDNTTLDFLPGRNIFLAQRKDMFRLNTDTALLGEYLKVEKNETVLDAGCGNGVLLLYAAQFDYRELIGIDVLASAIELADYNLKINGIENYSLVNDSIENFTRKVDVIVCNPPYFSYEGNPFVNDNGYLKTARHFTDNSLVSFGAAFARILKPSGRLYLVYRYDLWQDVERLFNEAGLFVSDKSVVTENRTVGNHIILATLKFST